MSRAVLAEPDRVVRPDPDDRKAHECGQAHRAAHVVAEDEERRPVRLDDAAVHRHAVHDRAHRVLADSERHVAAGPVRREDAGAVEGRLRRLDEVGRAADHRRRERLERLHHGRAGAARGELRLVGRVERRQRLLPTVEQAFPHVRGPSPRPGPGNAFRQASKRRAPLVFERVALAQRDSCARRRRPARRRSLRDPIRAPPSSPSPRPRRAAPRAPSPCPAHAAPGRRCGSGRRSATGARSRPSPARKRAAGASRSFTSATCSTCQPYDSKRAARVLRVEGERGRSVDRDPVVVVDEDRAFRARRRRPATPPRPRRPPSGRRRSRCRTRGGRRPRVPAGCSAGRGSARPSPSRPRSRCPDPSGPVVVSMPGVRKCSGWPGVRDSHWRNRFSSAIGRS